MIEVKNWLPPRRQSREFTAKGHPSGVMEVFYTLFWVVVYTGVYTYQNSLN